MKPVYDRPWLLHKYYLAGGESESLANSKIKAQNIFCISIPIHYFDLDAFFIHYIEWKLEPTKTNVESNNKTR